MQDILKLGPFIIKVQLLVLALSGAFGYIVLQLRLKGEKSLNKVVQEKILDSLLIIIFAWKLSPIVFNPVKFIKNPLSLMYFTGGTRGVLLSLTIAAAYLIYSSKKQGLRVWIYADLIVTGFLAGAILYNLAALIVLKQSFAFYGSQLLLSALFLLWKIKKFRIIGNPRNLNELLMWFSLGEIFIFHLKGWERFSLQQLLLYVLAIVATGANLFWKEKQ